MAMESDVFKMNGNYKCIKTLTNLFKKGNSYLFKNNITIDAEGEGHLITDKSFLNMYFVKEIVLYKIGDRFRQLHTLSATPVMLPRILEIACIDSESYVFKAMTGRFCGLSITHEKFEQYIKDKWFREVKK